LLERFFHLWGGPLKTIVRCAVNCAKTAEPIEMPFAMWTQLAQETMH